MTIRVLVADDHPVFRYGMRAILASKPDVELVGEAKDGEEAVALALEWEYTVTKQINALLDCASSERDYVGHDFLEWFAREQLEEVSSLDLLLKMVRRAGESGLMHVENAIASGRLAGRGAPAEGE